MLENLSDDERIKEEIDSLFEAAERERYVHSRSKETFDDIAGLWFLGDAFQSVLVRISCNYIVSSFLLNSLALIYQRIRSDCDLPEFNAIVLADDEARQRFTKEIERLKSNSTFVQWMKVFLIPKCEELLHRVEGESLEDIARIGNLADSTEHIAKQYISREDDDVWVYDSIFQFADELLLSSGESTTFEEAIAFVIPEQRDVGWSWNSFFTSGLPVSGADQNAFRYEIPVGRSATNTHQELKAVA